MAQLTDTLVSGDERVTGMIYGTQAGNYATCSTPAATAAKAVTIPGFVLTTGVHVRIKFSANNTAATPTLNVSETGAKAIKVKGNNLAAAGDLAANGIYEFVYDGTNWELTGAVCGKATTANYGYVQLATGDMNGQANVDGVAVSKNHTHSQYLPKAGGTMTGGITLPTNFYHKDSKFGIDAKNSDIINANSIYFGDECTDTQEGIHFKRGDSGNTDNYDTIWIDNGKICFVPNHAVSTGTSSSSAQIVPRLPSSVSDNQVVFTNGTTGALKTSAASSLSVGTASDYNTSSGTIKTKFDELTIRASSSNYIYGFMFKKPLDNNSWYDGYGFSMMTFYGGSGHLYEIGVRLQVPTSSNPFPSGSRLVVTVMGEDDNFVLGFNENVWYKIVDNNELQILFLTPLNSGGTKRTQMPGVVTRDSNLTTSNSTILTSSNWEGATESVLVAAGWTHKDSSEVVFRRTLTTEGTTLTIAKGGTAKSTRKAATNNLFSDIDSSTTNINENTQLVFKYVTPSDTNGIFYYRTADYLWNWIRTQLGYNSSSNKYGFNISGNADTATTLSGTLPINKGGTNATTAKAAQYNLLHDMSSSNSAVTNSTPIVYKDPNDSSSSGTIYYRTADRLWKYMNRYSRRYVMTEYSAGTRYFLIAHKTYTYPGNFVERRTFKLTVNGEYEYGMVFSLDFNGSYNSKYHTSALSRAGWNLISIQGTSANDFLETIHVRYAFAQDTNNNNNPILSIYIYINREHCQNNYTSFRLEPMSFCHGDRDLITDCGSETWTFYDDVLTANDYISNESLNGTLCGCQGRITSYMDVSNASYATSAGTAATATYATSAGTAATATTASKLSAGAGASNRPIYINNNGEPTPIPYSPAAGHENYLNMPVDSAYGAVAALTAGALSLGGTPVGSATRPVYFDSQGLPQVIQYTQNEFVGSEHCLNLTVSKAFSAQYINGYSFVVGAYAGATNTIYLD